jgi:signal transduction histidine kinase
LTKHAHASVVNVELDTPDAILQLAIRDDGIGGADSAQGSGLVALTDCIEALGGTLEVADISAQTVTSEQQVWNSAYAFAYPSLNANAHSEIGIAVGVGGSSNNA